MSEDYQNFTSKRGQIKCDTYDVSRKAKKRKMFSNNKLISRKNNLEAGLKGFLVTYNHNEKFCLNETYHLLNAYADQLPESDDIHLKHNDQDLDELLKKEISDNNEKRKRFISLHTNCKNVLFIKASENIDPFLLTRNIFNDINSVNRPIIKTILRLLPISLTCKSHIKNICQAFRAILEQQTKEFTTYKIFIKIRNYDSINKETILEELVKIIEEIRPEWKVDFGNPIIAVIVTIVNKICCLSFLKDFINLKKYNPIEYDNSINNKSSSQKKIIQGKI